MNRESDQCKQPSVQMAQSAQSSCEAVAVSPSSGWQAIDNQTRHEQPESQARQEISRERNNQVGVSSELLIGSQSQNYLAHRKEPMSEKEMLQGLVDEISEHDRHRI